MATIVIDAGRPKSLKVASAVTAHTPIKYVTTDGQIGPMTATSEVCAGIALETVAAGGVCAVARIGDIVEVVAQGTCTLGGPAMWATGNKVVDASGDVKTIGTFVTGTTTDTDLVSIEFCPGTIGTG